MKQGAKTKAERIFIPGLAGQLEALLEWDPKLTSRAATLVCHPHPAYGGPMHNKVVFRAAKAALQAGMPALRFNFRGVDKSAGIFARGIGEREDVRAALDFLAARFPDVPICLIGFSFGAWVGLEVGAFDARVAALVGLGMPALSTDLSFLQSTTKPKLIVQGTRDEPGPCARVALLFASLPEPKRLHWVESTDHFFTGKLEEVQGAVRAFLEELPVAALGQKN